MTFISAGERPASAAAPGRFLFGLWHRFAQARSERRQRLALRALLQFDPHRLEDLGLCRQDVLDALARPHGHPTGLAAHRARRARAWLRAS
jgi:uncharacterized protein YjiS (DUF1127 family)